MSRPPFDQNGYWIDRHRRLAGDPRSVGNLGKSVAENAVGEAALRAALRLALQAAAPHAAVLEIGCGYGRLADVFIDAGLDYAGLDVSPEAVAAARRREARGRYVSGPALDTDWGGPRDLVAVIYVFVHFVEDAGWRRLIGRISEFLPSGGALLFADAIPAARRLPAPHVCERTLEEYRAALEETGLSLDTGFRDRLRSLAAGQPGTGPFHLARKL